MILVGALYRHGIISAISANEDLKRLSLPKKAKEIKKRMILERKKSAGVAPGEYSLKGIALNLAMSSLFVSPFLLFGEIMNVKEIFVTNALLVAIALVIPPFSWKYPHPYSDQAHMQLRTRVDHIVMTGRGRFFCASIFLFFFCNGHYLLIGCTVKEALSGNVWTLAAARLVLELQVQRAMRKARIHVGERINIGSSTQEEEAEETLYPAMDVYYPNDEKRSLKSACLYFHGGTFTTGSKEWGAAPMRLLAHYGVTGFSIGYRLTSFASSRGLAGALTDASQALAYVKRNARKYRLDSNRIFLMGDSAGGLLATLLATDKNSGVAALVAARPISTLKGLEWFGRGTRRIPLNTYLTDSTTNIADFINRHVLAGQFLLFGRRLRGWLPARYAPKEAHLFSPISRLEAGTHKLPPAFFSAAVNDTTIPFDQVKDLGRAYKSKGQATLLKFSGNLDPFHGTLHLLPLGRSHLLDFLQRHKLIETKSPNDLSTYALLCDQLDHFVIHLPSPPSGPYLAAPTTLSRR